MKPAADLRFRVVEKRLRLSERGGRELLHLAELSDLAGLGVELAPAGLHLSIIFSRKPWPRAPRGLA